MKTLFLFHGGCFDGHTAAWVYSRFVDREAEFVGVKYGDPPPDVRDRDVVIADFSFPRAQTKEIIATAKSTILLDHHVTAREALHDINGELQYDGIGKQARIVFDMERSGAGIVWDELACRKDGGLGPAYIGKRPKLVDYVEDRDLWRMRLPYTHEFNANIYAAEMTFESWDKLDHAALDAMVVRGEGILAYIRQYGTKALAEARLLEWPSLWREHWASVPADDPRTFVWCVNMPYMNCSDYLDRLLKEKDVPFVAGYFRRGDGRWQFSLRSRVDFSVADVAKHFGGGGHLQAAGFDVANLAEVFGE
jgi:oligoribonuclease NrnB/cAMP/cGMP phosphodiesterase (DHH superfamily)